MQSPEELTRIWVERLVVGENLCPFASPVMDGLKIEVSRAESENELTHGFLRLLNEVQMADSERLPTALFVAENAMQDFPDYLDWLSLCEQLVEEAGLDGTIQLAGFHPHYEFDGEAPDDVSHFTNRSPFPMVHLIRESDISNALRNVSRPQAIPERNQRHMRRLGKDGLLQLMPELADTAVFK